MTTLCWCSRCGTLDYCANGELVSAFVETHGHGVVKAARDIDFDSIRQFLVAGDAPMSGKEVTGHAMVTARCPKGHMRTIHPHEIPEGQIPMCLVDRCYKPMIAHSAETCYCDWPEMVP